MTQAFNGLVFRAVFRHPRLGCMLSLRKAAYVLWTTRRSFISILW